MRAHMLPCPACRRHVRTTEGACPFCVAPLSLEFARTPAPVIPSARIGRAAIMAFRTLGASALAAGALTACGDDDMDMEPPIVDAAYGGPPRDAGPDVADMAPPMVDAAYGAPPFDMGPDPMALGPPMVDAAYGAPPPSDAAAIDDVGLSQLYGAVPADASSESR